MKTQLVITYFDNVIHYHTCTRGWKIEASMRCIVIGTDVPRTYIPLDSIRSFNIENYGDDD